MSLLPDASQIMATSPQPPAQLSKGTIFATSGLGGIFGWAIVHPANTIAVRWNLASMQGSQFSLGSMIKNNGIMSVYDGVAAGCWRQVFYASTRFGLFEIMRDKAHEMRGKTDFASRVVIGAFSGGVAAFVSCPMEVATVRLSNDATLPPAKRRNYTSVFNTMSRITKEEGVSAFWRGSAPFVQRAMLVGIFQVATLDQFKEMYCSWFQQKKNSIMNVFCAAMTSGLIYSVATMPLESSKNRMAFQRPDPSTGILPYRTTLQTMMDISKKEGFLSLYNGFPFYYVRCGGHTVCMFIIVQMLRDAYAATS